MAFRVYFAGSEERFYPLLGCPPARHGAMTLLSAGGSKWDSARSPVRSFSRPIAPQTKRGAMSAAHARLASVRRPAGRQTAGSNPPSLSLSPAQNCCRLRTSLSSPLSLPPFPRCSLFRSLGPHVLPGGREEEKGNTLRSVYLRERLCACVPTWLLCRSRCHSHFFSVAETTSS